MESFGKVCAIPKQAFILFHRPIRLCVSSYCNFRCVCVCVLVHGSNTCRTGNALRFVCFAVSLKVQVFTFLSVSLSERRPDKSCHAPDRTPPSAAHSTGVYFWGKTAGGERDDKQTSVTCSRQVWPLFTRLAHARMKREICFHNAILWWHTKHKHVHCNALS